MTIEAKIVSSDFVNNLADSSGRASHICGALRAHCSCLSCYSRAVRTGHTVHACRAITVLSVQATLFELVALVIFFVLSSLAI